MAIKVQGTTVIDDSKNISNIGVATVGILSANQITVDGTTGTSGVGVANYVLVSGGTSGDISWQPVTAVGSGTLDGINILEEGALVGTAGSVINVNFVGNNVTATGVALGLTATVTLSDTPTYDSLNVTGFSTFSDVVSIGATVGIGTRIDIVPYDTLSNGTLSFEGSQGQLFAITNNLSSGSIFSVNPISGIPIIDVLADRTIQLNPFGGNTGIGTTNPTAKLDVNGTLNVSGVSTFQGNVDLGDTDRLRLGDSQDLQIFHGGSNSFIQDTGSGNLFIGADTDVQITSSSTVSKKAIFTTGGPVELYYDNDKKFETTGYGVSIIGTGNTATITGPSNLVLDPATVGDATGTVTILGNLQVEGTQTIINSTTLEVDDKLVSIAKSATNGTQADGAGLEINGASATLTYASTGDKWVFNKAPYYNTNRILTTADEGTGNGLDADTLDGLEASQFLRSDAADTGTGLITLSNGLHVTSGNVGIGTDDPTDSLTILKDATGAGSGGLKLQTAGSNESFLTFGVSSSLSKAIFTSSFNGSGTALPMVFAVGPSSTDERLRITSTGNVGIGTDNPGAKLDVSGDARITGVVTATTFSGNGSLTNLTVSGVSTFQGNVYLGDNDVLNIGDNQDLQIYHEGSNSIIQDSGTGNLFIQGSTAVKITDLSANEMAVFIDNGAAELYYNASKKFETTSSGVSITGNIDVDNTTSIGSTTSSLSTLTQTAIHTELAVATYRSVEYTVQATQGTNFHATKILALHNGTTAYHSEYGTIFNNSSVASFDVDISGGNLRLLATGASVSQTDYVVNFVATKV